MISQPVYELRPNEVYPALETSQAGLSASDVSARQALYGKNVLKEAEAAPVWMRFARHFLHPFSFVLIAAGVIAIAAGERLVGAAIWLMVIFNSGFSFWRVYRAEEAMQALRGLLPAAARVVRVGQEMSVPVAELVPGDVLILAEGDYVPADARVVEQYGLRVSNAVLTGEVIPARKTADASFREAISELERPNLVFAGTTIVSGTGRAVVFAIGMLTQFGRMAYLTESPREEVSIFQQELMQAARKISFVAAGVSGFVFLVALTDVGMGMREAFLLALGVMVAAIPEGLQANVTLALAAAAQRLARKGVLVKRLSALETLGAVSVICTDKSGTLTQNQMTVREMWAGGQRYTLTGIGYEPRGEIVPSPNGSGRQDLQLLLTAGSLCNNARLSGPAQGKRDWTFLGDQTEAAMRVAALKGGLDETETAAIYPRVHELPFDARRKRMATVHRLVEPQAGASDQFFGYPAGENRREIAFVKGAPRETLELCTHIRMNDQVVELDDRLRRLIAAVNDRYASQALRVLALAYRQLPPRTGAYVAEKIESGLTFLGLMAMNDPPRPGVEQAVRICRAAGIRIVMVTGDYGLTAASLGRRVRLVDAGARIVTGGELEAMDEAGLAALLEQEVVYARMAPEHKLRLVAAFQATGEVVAVTGDGVNDAPALRKADIGVAMGISGTEVAQKAAEIILTDDNLLHLTSAIEEGRTVFENLRKFITYIFSSNVPEILPFVLTALTNLPPALTLRQILAIDFGTDLLPGLALGAEAPEPGLMRRPPRPRTERVIDGVVLRRAFLWLGPIEAALAYSGFFLVYALFSSRPVFGWSGWEAIRRAALPGGGAAGPFSVYLLAITVYHAGVVMAQVGNAFACRTATERGRTLGWLKNRGLWGAVMAEIALILALLYIPQLSRLFNHIPLPAAFWGWLAVYGPLLYGLDWLRKQGARWLLEHKHRRGSSGEKPGQRQPGEMEAR